MGDREKALLELLDRLDALKEAKAINSRLVDGYLNEVQVIDCILRQRETKRANQSVCEEREEIHPLSSVFWKTKRKQEPCALLREPNTHQARIRKILAMRLLKKPSQIRILFPCVPTDDIRYLLSHSDGQAPPIPADALNPVFAELRSILDDGL